MKIQNIGNFYQSNAVSRNYKTQKLNRDVFEKSNVQSFKGLLDEEFKLAFQSLREKEFNMFMEVLSSKNVKKLLEQHKKTNINFTELINIVCQGSKDTANFLDNLMKDANISLYSFRNFLRIYYQNPKTKQDFEGQEIEALRIYCELEDKEDLGKFSELLLYLYNKNTDCDNIDEKTDINETVRFLKLTGLDNFRDFETKNSELSAKFNNFKNVSDKYDAICYLQETYPKKIAFINEILSEKPSEKNRTGEKIYAQNSDIIDYLYEANKGEHLGSLSLIIDEISSDKIKRPALKQIAPFFNNFETAQNKVNFYKFLNNYNISPDELNAIIKNPVVSDSDCITNAINKHFFVKEISSELKCSSKQAFDIYKNYADILNSIYLKCNDDEDILKAFFKTINLFSLNNSQAVLGLYNTINSTKKKSVTSDEIKEFISLMAFCDSNKIIQEARAKKVSPVDVLRNEQEKYLKVKDEIKDFILNDDSYCFLGLDSFEIYTKYKDLINKNPFSVKSVLQDIVGLNVENSSDYLKKTARLEEFQQYFDDKRTLFEFIENTRIKFDDSKDDEKNIQNCKKLFEKLDRAQIMRLSESGFLSKSVTSFDEFFEMFETSDLLTDVINLIIDKDIASASDFMDFIKTYENQGFENILSHLSCAQDIDFTIYKSMLEKIQNQLNRYNIPFEIDNTNINLIDTDYFKYIDDFSYGDTLYLINSLSGADEKGNFISKLSESRVKTIREYSRFNIANEIVNKTYDEDAYNNIMSIFGLEKERLGLEKDCSDYIYARMIAQKLDDEFIDFVNSSEWLNYRGDNSYPNLSLHAKLRLIDRFALEQCGSLQDLYSENTQNYIKNLLKTIYFENPSQITEDKKDGKITTFFEFEYDTIKTVFGPDGKMVTIIAKNR